MSSGELRCFKYGCCCKKSQKFIHGVTALNDGQGSVFFSFAQHCDVTVKPTFNLKNHHLITVSLLAYELLNYGLNHICEVTEIWNVDKQVLIASSLSPGIICA